MGISKTDICNQALSYLANSAELSDVDSERSKEAQACRRFYDTTRDEVLRAFAWPFATTDAALTLVTDFTLLTTFSEWRYSYRYPVDALYFIRIQNGYSRIETRQTRIPYRIRADANGRLIYTDRITAIGEYVMAITSEDFFPPDFITAFALLLASKIGPRVAGGDQFKLADRAFTLYNAAIASAEVRAANEEQSDPEPPSDFERSRR